MSFLLKELTIKKYQICERRRVYSEVLQLTCDQAFLHVKSYGIALSQVTKGNMGQLATPEIP